MAIRSLSADSPLRLVWKGVEKVRDYRASDVPLSKAVMMLMRQAAQRRRLYMLAKYVLPRYALKADSIRFVSDSDNAVFQVEADGAKYALRSTLPIAGQQRGFRQSCCGYWPCETILHWVSPSLWQPRMVRLCRKCLHQRCPSHGRSPCSGGLRAGPSSTTCCNASVGIGETPPMS